jgi:hypothetical protein
MKKMKLLTDYVTNNLFWLHMGKTNTKPRNGNRISLLDRSDTLPMTGSFPPIKVVHYIFQYTMLNYTRSNIRDAPLAGATQLYIATEIFYTENPLIL